MLSVVKKLENYTSFMLLYGHMEIQKPNVLCTTPGLVAIRDQEIQRLSYLPEKVVASHLYSKRALRHLEQDMLDVANFKLFYATDKHVFDNNGSTPRIRSYVSTAIKRGLLNLARNDQGTMDRRSRKIKKIIDEISQPFYVQYGRYPTVYELMDHRKLKGVSLEDIIRCRNIGFFRKRYNLSLLGLDGDSLPTSAVGAFHYVRGAQEEIFEKSGIQSSLHYSSPEKLVQNDQLTAVILDRLESLPEDQMIVLKLRYIEELEYSEIALALDISEGTVKSRLSRGKYNLIRNLPEEIRSLFEN